MNSLLVVHHVWKSFVDLFHLVLAGLDLDLPSDDQEAESKPEIVDDIVGHRTTLTRRYLSLKLVSKLKSLTGSVQ